MTDMKTIETQLKQAKSIIDSLITLVSNGHSESTAIPAPIKNLHDLPDGFESLSALQQLRVIVDRDNYVVLDTETTGLRDGEVCSISIIDKEGEVLMNELVKPTRPIPSDATRIHGLTNLDVSEAPGWAEVAPRVVDILTGKDVVVYNAVYDRKIMHKSAEYAGIEKIDWKVLSPWVCAMEAFAEFYGDWNDFHQSYRWQKLSFAADHCGVAVKNAHDALGDVLMTLGIVKHMMIITPEDLPC